MLCDFFRINMPYGMEKKGDGWYFFNREYSPIGFNEKHVDSRLLDEIPISTLYPNLKSCVLKKLESLGCVLVKNESNEIFRIFFYNDGSNPVNTSVQKYFDVRFNRYMEIIKELSRLKTYK